MSLRTRIAIVLFCAVGLAAGADHLLSRRILSERCEQLELERARGEIVELQRIVGSRLAALQATARQVQEEAGSIGVGSAGSLGAMRYVLEQVPRDVVLLYDETGKVLFHRTRRAGSPWLIRTLPDGALPGNSPLLAEGPRAGLLDGEDAPLLVTEASLGGDPTLSVLVGEVLPLADLNVVQKDQATGTAVRWLTNRTTTEEDDLLRMRIDANDGFYFDPDVGGEAIRAWSTMPGLAESEALLLQVSSPRHLASLQSELDRHDLLSTAGLVVIFPFIMLLLLQRIVTGPLSALAQHVLTIGHSDDTSVRLNLDRKDEIGQLAGEFDYMLEKLEASRAEVVRTARMAGMSDVAAGVLHNIGNILNSVAISTHVCQKSLSEVSAPDDLHAVVSKLRENEGGLDRYLAEDPRGRHLVAFFEAAVEQLEGQIRSVRSEAEGMSDGVDQIAGLLDSLRATKRTLGVAEPVDLCAQLNSVLELCTRSEEVPGVQVIRDYDPSLTVVTDRHKLMETLVGLVRNALQSLAESPDGPRRLEVRLTRAEDAAVVTIRDTGVGIVAEDLDRIFAAHYTTRPGAKGLGLHFAATGIGELGGTLQASSDGPGKGARFTVTLPLTSDAESDGEPHSLAGTTAGASTSAEAEPHVLDHAEPPSAGAATTSAPSELRA